MRTFVGYIIMSPACVAGYFLFRSMFSRSENFKPSDFMTFPGGSGEYKATFSAKGWHYQRLGWALVYAQILLLLILFVFEEFGLLNWFISGSK
jgi:hypothetical protein